MGAPRPFSASVHVDVRLASAVLSRADFGFCRVHTSSALLYEGLEHFIAGCCALLRKDEMLCLVHLAYSVVARGELIVSSESRHSRERVDTYKVLMYIRSTIGASASGL